MALTFVRANSDYLDGGSPNPVTAYPFSLACWVYPLDMSGTSKWGNIISQGHWNTNKSGFWWDVRSGNSSNEKKIQMSLADSGGNTDVWSSSQLTQDVWQHIAVTITSSNIIFYIDGSQDVSRGNSQAFTASSNHNLFIGAENDGSNGTWSLGHLDARLAELSIWDIALSSAQVASLATGVSPMLVGTSNVVRYWPLMDATFPAIDIVGKQDAALGAAPDKAVHPRMFYPSKQKIVFPPAAAAASDPFFAHRIDRISKGQGPVDAAMLGGVMIE